jgi:murein L,D-transpeptidase YafK
MGRLAAAALVAFGLTATAAIAQSPLAPEDPPTLFQQELDAALLPLKGVALAPLSGVTLLIGQTTLEPAANALEDQATGAAGAAAAADRKIQELLNQYQLRAQDSGKLPPEGTLPSPILHLAGAVRGAIVVDLPRSRLYALDNADGQLRVVREYYVSIAKNGFGKHTAGDLRTPVGIYYVTGFTPGSTLPDMYGAGAFPVNYPNAWDRRHGYTGSGIWLHGVPHDIYMRPPLDSQGCVVLSNNDLLSLRAVIAPRETPIVLADHVDWVPAQTMRAESDELRGRIERWRQLWSEMDTEGYLEFYADDFHTTDGMGRAAFARHKRRVNADKDRIDVRVDDLSLFRYPGEESLVMAEFTQEYRSSNFSTVSHKEQFWRREAKGNWEIVLEGER